MNKEELRKDFEKYYQSKYPFGMTAMRALTSDTNLSRMGYVSPSILEEREMHVTQMDVFSRLMMERQIFFGTEVDSDSTKVVVAQLLYLDSIGNNDITLLINSGGGECYSGMGMLDTMSFVKSPIATQNIGLCASMAAMILMCGTRGKRTALQHSRTMIHQPLQSGGHGGQATDIEINAREILNLREELYEIINLRTGKPIEQIRLDCERDHWLTSKETLEYGIIDNIVPCNNWDKTDK